MDNTINSLVSQTVGGAGTTSAANSPWVAIYQNTLGRAPTQAELNRWGNSPTITPQQLDKFLGEARNEAVNTMPKTGAVGNIAQQILAQGNTGQWTGQGYGSPEKTAYDMAVMLAGQGITDINQLGMVDKIGGIGVSPVYDQSGTGQIVGFTDSKGNAVDPSKVKPSEDGDGGYYTTGVIGKTFGNKQTGQEISPYYDKAGQVGADIWGGTFQGKGSTAYGVSFDESGKPTLYSKYGGSSSNAKDYAPLLAIGALALGAPYLAELGGLGAGATTAGLGDLGAMGALGEGIGAGTAAGTAAGTGATLASLGDLGAMGALGEGAGTVAGMGAGTGLTAAGAGGLGGLGGAAGLDGALGSGLTAAGAGGLGGATGAAGLEGALGAGIGGGLGATNAALGGSALGSTLGSLATGVGAGALGSTIGGLSTGVGSALGAGAGSALGAGAGSALGTSLATGLGLNALGSVLGSAANSSGISAAKDLINQYGTKAENNLAKAYADAQALNTANKTDLASNYATTQGKLGDIYNQQVGFQKPYQAVGQAGSQGLLDNQGYFTHQFDVNDLNTNLAPNYAFMLNQGQMTNQRAGNIGGGALGGNVLQGLQKYTQDYAGNAYQKAFENYNTQRNNIFKSLKDMADVGTTSGAQLTNLGTNYGTNLGSLSSNYGSNITSNAGQGINAANAYGLNTANLATGIGSALANNATQAGANNASLLSNLGNTALFGSMIKAT